MKNKLLGYLYVIIATSAWGSIYVVSKFVLGYVPAFTLLFLGEKMNASFFVGAVLIIGGVILSVLAGQKKHPSKHGIHV